MNEWDQWFEDQRKKMAYLDSLPTRIKAMHRVYGKTEGHKCKECRHMQGRSYARTYYKCLKSKVTGGAATDWRLNWPACGLFQEDEAPHD